MTGPVPEEDPNPRDVVSEKPAARHPLSDVDGADDAEEPGPGTAVDPDTGLEEAPGAHEG